MAWWRPNGGGPADKAAGLAKAACRGASSMVMVGFAATYFSVLSVGSIAWIAMAFAPAIVPSTSLRAAPWASAPLAWDCALATLAWAAWVARAIHRLAKPRLRRTLPGGSWAAWTVVAWLAWMDAALELGRAPPDGFGASSSAGPAATLARGVAVAILALPRRSMACSLALAMMLAMPLGLHVAMAMAMPLAILDMLMPKGPGIGLLDRVKRVALDLSEEGSADWALAERAQIDKEVGKTLGEAARRPGAEDGLVGDPSAGEARRSRRL